MQKIITTTPKVSVVITTFNRAEYLIQAIRSVLAQTYSNYEVIVIDDGSTDNTQEKLTSQITDNRIKYIRQENRGPAEARNRGIEEAISEYIIFLDDDDIWLPIILEEEVKFLDTHTNVGLVSSQLAFINNAGQFTGKVWKPSTGIVNWKLFPYNQIASGSALIRRMLFIKNRLRFNPEYHCCADYEMWLKISRITKLFVLPNIFYLYRWHGVNISYDQQKHWLEHCKVVDTILNINNSIEAIKNPYIKNMKDSKDHSLRIKFIKRYINYLTSSSSRALTINDKIRIKYYWDNKIWHLMRDNQKFDMNIINFFPIFKKMNNALVFIIFKFFDRFYFHSKKIKQLK